MNLKKADSGLTLLQIFIFCLTIALALACGGQSSNNGVLMLELEGTIDESTFPTGNSKPKRAPGTYTGRIINLDDPSEIWPLTFTSSHQFEVTLIRKTNLKLEIYLNSHFVFSRILNSNQTNVSSLSPTVNSITHLQTQWIEAYQLAHDNTSLEQAQRMANLDLFAQDELQEQEYNLTELYLQHPDLAVIISTYGQLFQFLSLDDISTALALINQSLKQSSAAAISSSYLTALNALTQSEVATTLLEAHEAAKNLSDNPIAVSHYSSLVNLFTNALLINTLNTIKIAPTFPALDSARLAGAGVLFNYDFPQATTTDRQGLSNDGYQGIWITSSPTGLIDASGNGGLNLKVIPSIDDIGKDFEYQVSINGANGTGPVAVSVQFSVVNSEIISKDRKRIQDTPILGPVLDDTHFYLISRGASGNFLDKYSQSDLLIDGSGTFLSASRWLLPAAFSNLQDLVYHNQLLYVAGGAQGTIAFDHSFNQLNTSAPTYSNTALAATKIAFLNEHLYALDATFTPVLTKSDLDLQNPQIQTELNSLFTGAVNIQIANFYDDYLYLGANLQAHAYKEIQSSLILADELPSLYAKYTILEDSNAITAPLALYKDKKIDRYSIVANEFSALTLTSTLVTLQKPIIGNGTYLFTPNSNSAGTIAGYSITTHDLTPILSQPTNNPIYFEAVSNKLLFTIQNIPEGIDFGKSGALLYTIGAGNKTQFDEGFIRVHKVQPIDP